MRPGLLWGGRRVYQLGTVTKLISQVGVPRSLRVGSGLRVDTYVPVESQGRYVISIRMRVLGDGEAQGCVNAYIRGVDRAVDAHLSCTDSPDWVWRTFVLNLQTWPAEWRDMFLYVARSPDRPGVEVQFDNTILFPLDTSVLTKVPFQ